jgi:hypothetical protein
VTSPAALDVRRAGDEADELRVVGLQLAGVFDGDDAFPVVDPAEQGVEQRGLAGSGTAADDERQAGGDDRLEYAVRVVVERAEPAQRVEVMTRAAKYAQRQAGAVGGDRREDRVQAYPAERAGRQPGVDERLRVVEPPPADEGETLREAADGVFVGEGHLGAAKTAVAVEPDLVRRGDEDVGRAGRAEQGIERAGADELLAHQAQGLKDIRVADDAAGLLADGLGHFGGRDFRATAGKAAADPVDEVGRHAHDRPRPRESAGSPTCSSARAEGAGDGPLSWTVETVGESGVDSGRSMSGMDGLLRCSGACSRRVVSPMDCGLARRRGGMSSSWLGGVIRSWCGSR